MNSQDPNLLQQVLGEKNIILAGFGALGGMVRSAALHTTWLEGIRVTFIGAATSFGVGMLAPYLLRPWIGELPEGIHGALGTLSATSFLIGLISVTMIERLIAGRALKSDESDE